VVAKLATLVDSFTAPTINPALWDTIVGTATLDTVNDLVSLAVPTTNGATNIFGSTTPFDATGSSIYAQIGAGANGNGGVATGLRLSRDVNNFVLLRVISGAFSAVLMTAGAPVTTTLPSYDPHAHRWWRITESGSQFVCAASPDGFNWSTLATLSYSWAATAVTVAFLTAATVTEVAGNVATISHINSRLGGIANPNWPVVEDAWGPYWSANGGNVPADRYVEVTDRTRNSSNVSRGRQYELDQVRSGTHSATLANTDAALDPANAAGPYAGRVLPYSPYRKRAQWPPTRNLLTQAQATGGDLGGFPVGVIPAGAAVLSASDTGGGQIVTSGTAWRGGTVFQFAVPAATTVGTLVGYTAQAGVVPGVQYTVQMRVRNVTAATSAQVKLALAWYTTAGAAPTSFTYGSTVTLTGSTTAAWTQVTVTGTAPAGAAGFADGVAVAAAPGSAVAVQVDEWQVEKAAAASAWAAPGVWSGIIAGFVEDWPSTWDMSGTYGVVSPSVVDSFALLSQRALNDPLTSEIQSHNPRFLFQLDDPVGSTSAADSTGKYQPAPVKAGKYGPGVLTFATSVTASDATGGIFTGAPGPVLHVANSSPATNILAPASFLSLDAVGIVGPANPAGPWTRVVAFRYTGPASRSFRSAMWSCFDSQRPVVGSGLEIGVDQNGHFYVDMGGPDPASGVTMVESIVTADDGNWHLGMVVYDDTVDTFFVAIDTFRASFPGIASNGRIPTGLTSDSLGNYVDKTNGNGTIFNWSGDLAFAAEFPVALTSTDRGNLYTAWKAACAGESTSARYSRILRYAGYNGPSSVQTGLTTSMGAADFGGQDAVTALQGVVDTEGGQHYVSSSGTVTFLSRAARYNALTPTYVFGERADLGEWPYEDCQTDFDSTHLGNVVQVTQGGTGQVLSAQDQASIDAYFPRTLSRTINSSSALECQDAASYLLSRYKQPATRISTLKLHPSANPAMWPVCLALELGTRVRVMRRPPAPAPPIQVECFVENINWTFDDTGEAVLTLQCSPADLTPYGVIASIHTTLHTSVASGVTAISIDHPQDNTNLASQQFWPGQQLVLGQNTPNQETVTVSAIGATSPGWSTATITLTAATTKAHTAGDTICEPLPAGITDPTTWDASATFDAVAFAY
jgi:hypothetical protein